MTKTDFLLSPQECSMQAARCIGCGTCLTVCPVFGEDPREELTARGRNAQIHDLQRKAEQTGLVESMAKCLACGRCAMVCPRGIPNDSIVTSLRAQAARHHGLPLTKKAAFRMLLTDRRRMGRALRLAAKFQKLLPVTREVAWAALTVKPCRLCAICRSFFPAWWGGAICLPCMKPFCQNA